MNPEIKTLVDAHGIPPDGRLPLSAQRAAESQREAHAQRARSRTRATATAVAVVLVGTAIFAAFDGAYAGSYAGSHPARGRQACGAVRSAQCAALQAANSCVPAEAPKGYTALCPIGQEKSPAASGWPRPIVADTTPSIVFYECWGGGPIVSDPEDCPPKEHGGYR